MKQSLESSEDTSQQKKPQFAIQRIFLTESSFESPKVPAIFLEDWEPQVQLNVDMDHTVLNPEIYLLNLHMTLTARNQDAVVFLVELTQSGIFTISGLNEQEIHRTLYCYCAHLLFPFAAESIHSLISKGGFQQAALYLTPINFDALYEEKMTEALKKEL